MSKWLHRHHFGSKKPTGVPHKFDKVKPPALIEAYHELKVSCTEQESILFMDAVHPTPATKISYGGIRRGPDKPLQTTGSRTGLNIIGGRNVNDISSILVSKYDSINSQSILDFFHRLRENYPWSDKLHLILDGGGYQRSDMVKKAVHWLNIELDYLPPDSPNLNPIERLWKGMNEKVRTNIYFQNKRDFIAGIDEFFTLTLANIAVRLWSPINDNFLVLTRASSG